MCEKTLNKKISKNSCRKFMEFQGVLRLSIVERSKTLF